MMSTGRESRQLDTEAKRDPSPRDMDNHMSHLNTSQWVLFKRHLMTMSRRESRQLDTEATRDPSPRDMDNHMSHLNISQWVLFKRHLMTLSRPEFDKIHRVKMVDSR